MGVKYVPINIRLTEEQYERLRREAFETKKSQAEITREALEMRWKEMDQRDLQEELDELIKAKTDGRMVVLCPKCKYAGFSKTTAYAYVCKNRLSPCRDRTTTSDFGCVYGQKKEIEADV